MVMDNQLLQEFVKNVIFLALLAPTLPQLVAHNAIQTR